MDSKKLLELYKEATTMMAKYETAILENATLDEKRFVFFQERVEYWSEVASELRKQLFKGEGNGIS